MLEESAPQLIAYSYESDPGVILMTNLLHAHSSGDVMAFKRIMEDKDPLLTDPFLQTHLTLAAQRGLMKRIQQFVVPFTRVKVSLISQVRCTSTIAKILRFVCIGVGDF